VQQVVAKQGQTSVSRFDGELVHAIDEFAFNDEGAGRSFTDRLARENCWTTEFAARVVNEYRRFVVLAFSAGHPVTPSDQVDQAWHLHLMYTRSYWEGLCAGVLKRPLHHSPSSGGPKEREKFRAQYSRTLESYASLFGASPPKDIWPDVDRRFDPDSYFARIDTSRNWVIRRPEWTHLPNSRLYAAIMASALGLLLMVVALSGSFPGTTSVQPAGAGIQISSGGRGFLVFVLAVGLLIAVSSFFNGRCPKCHRRRVLNRTGAKRKPAWWRPTQEEWVCGNCAHIVWKAEPSDDGGDGCGGCE
jgi:hypothetical protein